MIEESETITKVTFNIIYLWDGFNEFLKEHPIVKPHIYVNIYG